MNGRRDKAGPPYHRQISLPPEISSIADVDKGRITFAATAFYETYKSFLSERYSSDDSLTIHTISIFFTLFCHSPSSGRAIWPCAIPYEIAASSAES